MAESHFPNPALMEDFKYFSGESRWILAQYLVSRYKNITTYLDFTKNISSKDTITYGCKPRVADSTKLIRSMVISQQLQGKITSMLQSMQHPFAIIPITIINKKFCTEKPLNLSKHTVIALYNKITHELERIDIRKYHINMFNIKGLAKKIKSNVKSLVKKADVNVHVSGEVDVPNDFYPNIPVRVKYPVYLLAYLNERFANPTMTSSGVHERVAMLSLNTLCKIWDAYVNFITTHQTKICREGQTLHTENQRCVSMTGRTLKRMLIQPAMKACSNGKVYNMFSSKCTHPKSLKDINIMLNEALSTNVRHDTDFVSLGILSSIIASMNFVMSKHTNGHFLLPSRKRIIEKKHFSIKWEWQDEIKELAMAIPWKFWK